jgi:outer membrane protein assembly factor BamD
MKLTRPSRARWLLFGLALLAACATKQVNPATLTPDDLYQRANAAFTARKFDRAIPLLEAFVQQHGGDARAPEAQRMLAKSHYEKHDYITAAAEYQRLVEAYPNSPLNLDARFAICQSYLQLSPKPALDQEYTRAALGHCQSIATGFAGTPQAEQAAKIVSQLNEKLAKKMYDNAIFYFKRHAYDAAIVYFGQVLDTYPETSLAPAALGKMVETYHILGYVEEAAQARSRLLKDYPESAEARALPPAPPAADSTKSGPAPADTARAAG